MGCRDLDSGGGSEARPAGGRSRLEVPGTLDALRDVAADRDLFVYWVGPSRPEEADRPPALRALADRPGAPIDVDWDPAA